jgi:hypothetical protein
VHPVCAAPGIAVGTQPADSGFTAQRSLPVLLIAHLADHESVNIRLASLTSSWENDATSVIRDLASTSVHSVQ